MHQRHHPRTWGKTRGYLPPCLRYGPSGLCIHLLVCLFNRLSCPALLFRSASDFHSFTHTYACLPPPSPRLPPSMVFIYRRVRSVPRMLQWSSKYSLDNLMLIYVCATAFLIAFPRHVPSHVPSLARIQPKYWVLLPFGVCASTSPPPAWTLKSRLRARSPAECRGTKVAGGVFTVVAARVLSWRN